MTQLEDIQQEDAMYPWLVDGCMADNFLDQNYNADLLDAMADMAYEQEQAMRESNQSEWTLIEDNGKFIGFSVTNQEPEWEGVIHDDEDS
jgi:hypothetical protein